MARLVSSSHAATTCCYSITLVARTLSEAGISGSRAFAVFILTTKSNGWAALPGDPRFLAPQELGHITRRPAYPLPSWCMAPVAYRLMWSSGFRCSMRWALHSMIFQRVPRSQLAMSASLIGRSGSSAFRLSTTAVSMSLTGSCFSTESAPGPFHHGIRRRGGTIFGSALPLDER